MWRLGVGRWPARFDVGCAAYSALRQFGLRKREFKPTGRISMSDNRGSDNRGYHAHVYYNPETKPVAARLRETIIAKFAVEPGGFSDEPRGPHPISQFNVIFKNEEFRNIVPWLMLNREGLDVLVHPLTESSYDDHSKNALWLGTPVPMKLDILRPTYRAELLPKDLQHTA
jgi:aromatic ring-cleaving dioxygenase